MSVSPTSYAALLYPRSTGLYWNSSNGLPVSLIYAVPDRALFPNPYEIELTASESLFLTGPTTMGLRIIETAPSGQEAAINDPIQGVSRSISDIANVSLSPLIPATSAELGQAHIRLWNYNQEALSLGGGPRFPAAFTYDVREVPSGLLLHEDIFVDPTRLGSTFDATTVLHGGSLYYALLHEFLHALGLKHPNDVPGDPTFDEATSGLDQQTTERFAQTVNRLKTVATVLFIAHQVPKGLTVDAVENVRDDRALRMEVVEAMETSDGA